MKEKILSALKTKFQGVNANILDRIAAQLAKTVTTEDQVTTAVEGVTQGFIDVIEAYGDSRATDAQKTAVANYEQKHNIKDGKPIAPPPTPTTPPQPGPDTPPWAQALIDSNKELTERLNKMEGEHTDASRKAELDGILSKLPETLRKGYSRISVSGLTDEEFSTLKTDITSEVEAISKEAHVKGAIFGRPMTHGSASGEQAKEASEAELKAATEKLNL